MAKERDEGVVDEVVQLPDIHANKRRQEEVPQEADECDLSSADPSVDMTGDPGDGERIYAGPAVLTADFDWEKYGAIHALNEKVQELEAENHAKDDTIVQLQNALLALQDDERYVSETQGINAAAAAGKQIARKNRALRSQMTRLNSENARLRAQVQQLHQVIGSEPALAVDTHTVQSAELGDNEKLAIRTLREKWKSSKHRVGLLSSQLADLKEELRKYKNVLRHEIGGDNETLRRALTAQGGGSDAVLWQGRAQQIVELQAKNERLKEKLRTRSAGAIGDVVRERKGSSGGFGERQRRELEKSKMQRKADVEQLHSQLKSLQKEMTQLKMKHDAAQARKHSVERELKQLRTVLKTLESENELNQNKARQATALIAKAERSMKKVEDEKISEKAKYQNELNIFASAKVQLEQQIVNQKRIIEVLQKRAANATRGIHHQQQQQQQQRNPDLSNSRVRELELLLQDWDRNESEHKLRFVTALNEKLQRMVENASQGDACHQQTVERCQRLERLVEKGKRHIVALQAGNKDAPCIKDKDKLGTKGLLEDVYKRHRVELDAKDRELALARETLAQLQRLHELATRDLSNKMALLRSELDSLN